MSELEVKLARQRRINGETHGKANASQITAPAPAAAPAAPARVSELGAKPLRRRRINGEAHGKADPYPVAAVTTAAAAPAAMPASTAPPRPVQTAVVRPSDTSVPLINSTRGRNVGRERDEQAEAIAKLKADEHDQTVTQLKAQLKSTRDKYDRTVTQQQWTINLLRHERDTCVTQLKAEGDEHDRTVTQLKAQLKAKCDEHDQTVTQLRHRLDECEQTWKQTVSKLEDEKNKLEKQLEHKVGRHLPRHQENSILLQINNLARPRYAFLVGVGAGYEEGSVLANPANDVTDLSEKLSLLGFKCLSLVDEGATISNVQRNFKHFLRLVQDTDEVVAEEGNADLSIVLFFFSGHGCSRKGEEHLCLMNNEELPYNWLLGELGKRTPLRGKSSKDAMGTRRRMPANIVITDCCRAEKKGMQKILEPADTCQVFSCRSSQSASDGPPGRNGLFTEHLLANLTIGLEKPLDQLLFDVRVGVKRSRRGIQQPITRNSINVPIVLVATKVKEKANEYIQHEIGLLKENSQRWERVVCAFNAIPTGFYDAAGKLRTDAFEAVSFLSRKMREVGQGMGAFFTWRGQQSTSVRSEEIPPPSRFHQSLRQ